MSMLNYGVAVSGDDIFSIAPTGVVWMQRDERVFHHEVPRAAWRCLSEELLQFAPPMLQVTKYDPEEENIVLDPNDEDEVANMGRPFSKLLNDPDFCLLNVYVDCIGYLNAVFKNKKTGEVEQSGMFSGELFVESRYNGFSAKTYKFYVHDSRDPISNEKTHRSVEIIEIGSDFARRITFGYDDTEGPDDYMHVNEFRP